MVGIVEWVGVRAHEERKVGADRQLVVGSVNTVGLEDGEEAGELVVGVRVGRAAADVGVAASRTDYHHNHNSRTRQTAQREDAVAGLAEEDSIVNCKFRNRN